MAGGNGSYVGFTIPGKMATNANAAYTCTPASNTVTFSATSANNASNLVFAAIDTDGKFIQSGWAYSGDFQ